MHVTILFPNMPLRRRHEISDALECAGLDVEGGGQVIETGVQDITLRIPRTKMKLLRAILRRFGNEYEIL